MIGRFIRWLLEVPDCAVPGCHRACAPDGRTCERHFIDKLGAVEVSKDGLTLTRLSGRV